MSPTHAYIRNNLLLQADALLKGFLEQILTKRSFVQPKGATDCGCTSCTYTTLLRSIYGLGYEKTILWC